MYYSEELPNFVYNLIDKIQPNPLSNLEKEIIQGIWNGLHYRDIAEKCKKKYSSKRDKYADKYISNTGGELLNKFNEGLEEIGISLERKINKRNFRKKVLAIKEDIIRKLEKLVSPYRVEESEYPDRPVPLNSRFYVERKLEASADRTIEDLAKQTIKKPGAVIRIIGARKSGATSLVNRITHHAESLGDRSVTIDFSDDADAPLASIKSFMKWFCDEVSAQLDLKDSFNEYFNSDDWSNSRASSCSEKYFERHLLTKLSPSSLLIVFDRIDYVFDERYEDTPRIVTARLFFALIRTWIERGSKFDVWKKVKYVIVQGKNEIEMGNKCSPFNIGEEIYLDNFSIPEIVDLASRYQLNWSESEIEKLANIFGENIGNPHLIRRVLHRAARDNLTFEKFLQLDLTKNSVFNRYLEN